MLGKWAAEGGVIEMEMFAVATVSGRREGMFPRVAEEIEGQGAQVKDGLLGTSFFKSWARQLTKAWSMVILTGHT